MRKERAIMFFNRFPHILLLFLLVFLGCVTVPKMNEQILQGSLSELWKEADILDKAQFYENERVVLNEIISQIPNHNLAFFRIEKSLFQEAKKKSQRGIDEKVQKAFDDFLDSFSSGQDIWTYPYTEEAIWILASSYYEQISPPDRSQKETKEFIRILENKLLFHYPDTNYLKIAEEMLYRARMNLARHSFFIGDFYLRTWALTSAELRFKSILEDYPGFLDEQVYARLDQIYLKKNPASWEKMKRFLFFEIESDTAKEAQSERKRIKEHEEQEPNKSLQLQLGQ